MQRQREKAERQRGKKCKERNIRTSGEETERADRE